MGLETNLLAKRFPDGTVYDYDDGLRATVETAPDGRRFIVKYQNGQGLVRLKELVARFNGGKLVTLRNIIPSWASSVFEKEFSQFRASHSSRSM